MDDKFRIKRIEPSMISYLIDLGEAVNLSPWSAQNYLDEILLETSLMYCIESDDGDLFGFVVGRTISGRNEDRIEAEIYNIAVMPDLFGKGVASTLLNYFIEMVSIADVSAIWLEVRASNIRALNFYKKFGFIEYSVRPNFYNNPRESAIVMCLLLKTEDA